MRVGEWCVCVCVCVCVMRVVGWWSVACGSSGRRRLVQVSVRRLWGGGTIDVDERDEMTSSRAKQRRRRTEGAAAAAGGQRAEGARTTVRVGTVVEWVVRKLSSVGAVGEERAVKW